MGKAKTTKSVKAPANRRAKSTGAPAAAAPVEEFGIGLAQPGEDPPDGSRRAVCPNCDAKHVVVRQGADGQPVLGQAGTWSIAFKCLACGHQVASLPVH